MRIPAISRMLALGLIAWSVSAPAQPDAAPARAEPPPGLADSLKAARHSLKIGPTGISGEGAALIRTAVGESRYVAIGEDHFTREIPRLASALCELMGPQGLSAYVVEAGPVGTGKIAPMLGAQDRAAQVAALGHSYPNSVAFIDGEDEIAAAAQCRRASGPAFRLIGVDQEFFGASGMLLDAILKRKLDAAARRAVGALRDEDRRASEKAAKTGDPSGLIMLSAEPARLEPVEAALRKGGDAEARRLFGELKTSHAIYALDHSGSPDANETRARLMKHNLVGSLPGTGKVLLKFGDWHLYKGVNPLGQRDIGNFIAERADGEGGRSLHILVLAAKGSHGQFGGYARQASAQAFTLSEDRDYHWFKIAADNQLTQGQAADGWTLFDLRRLRHRRIAGLDADWRRVIDGYDLMIVIPEASAARIIGY